MRKILLAVAIALSSGCATFSETPLASAEQKVFAATTDYNTALGFAVAYKQLPACGASVVVFLCADPAVVATLQKADNIAYEALKTAQTVVRGQNQSTSSLQTAVTWAQGAISAFSRVTSSLRTK